MFGHICISFSCFQLSFPFHLLIYSSYITYFICNTRLLRALNTYMNLTLHPSNIMSSFLSGITAIRIASIKTLFAFSYFFVPFYIGSETFETSTFIGYITFPCRTMKIESSISIVTVLEVMLKK